MKKKFNRQYVCSRESGFTLVEVVASIALVGTLLVTILMAYGRTARQVRLAQKRLAAIEAADQLMQQWLLDPQTVPIDQSGTISEEDRLEWRTQSIEKEGTEMLGVEVVRLEVFDHMRPDEILASVEFLVGIEEEKAIEQTNFITIETNPE